METLKWTEMTSIRCHHPQPPKTPRTTKIIPRPGNQRIDADPLGVGIKMYQKGWNKRKQTRIMVQRLLRGAVPGQVDGSAKHPRDWRVMPRRHLPHAERLQRLVALVGQEAHRSRSGSLWTTKKWILTSSPQSRLLQLQGQDLGGVLPDPGRTV